MSFFRIHSPFVFNYNLYDTCHVNYLGITFDRELNFHGLIEKSCCKALKTLCFIKRFSREYCYLEY